MADIYVGRAAQSGQAEAHPAHRQPGPSQSGHHRRRQYPARPSKRVGALKGSFFMLSLRDSPFSVPIWRVLAKGASSRNGTEKAAL